MPETPNSYSNASASPAATPSERMECLTTRSNESVASTIRPLNPSLQPSPAPSTPSILPSPSTAPQNAFNFGTPQPTGPMNATYKIPPRPKPGRKPATDEPQTKRKAQNREAQRNFRQRKAQRLTELEGEREQKDREHQDEKDHLQAQIDALTREVAKLAESERVAQRRLQESIANLRSVEEERNHFKSLYESSRTPSLRGGYGHDVSTPTSMTGGTVSSPAFSLTPLTNPSIGDPMVRHKSGLSGCDDCQPEKGNCACINAFTNGAEEPLSPMSDVRMRDADDGSNYEEREIDFTTQHSSLDKVDKRPSVAFITEPSVPETCGFCTDESNCVCAAEAKASIEQSLISNDTLPPIRTQVHLPHSPSDSRRRPGTCPDCKNNPQQRRWCQTVARQATPHASHGTNTSNEAKDRYTVGCTDAFHLFNKRIPMASESDRMEWTSDLETLPPGAGKKIYFSHLRPDKNEPPPVQDRKYTAVEIDSASILSTLTTHDRRHSTEKRKDPVLQKTVRFLEDLTERSREEEAGDSEGTSRRLHTRNSSMGSIGRILN